MNFSGNASCPEDDEKPPVLPVADEPKPNLLNALFGGEKSEDKKPETFPEPEAPKAEPEEAAKPPSLLESIFSSASKKGKGVVSLADSAVDSSLTNVTSLEVTENLPEDQKSPEGSPLDAMSQLLLNLRKQTEEKSREDMPTSHLVLEERPAAPPGGKMPKILIFGDELIDNMDTVLTEEFKYAIEIHMLDGAQTKNIQKYITESIGTRKDAEVCIFHVGTNDIANKRTERHKVENSLHADGKI